MRLYGAAIAIVSGAYSAFVPVSGTGMTAGGWFMLAPLLYSDVGILATAGTQLAGTIISTFGLYVTIASLTNDPA